MWCACCKQQGASCWLSIGCGIASALRCLAALSPPGTYLASIPCFPLPPLLSQPRRCSVAGLLRSLSMRRAHHAALRACPGLLPALHRLLLPGARGWTVLKAAVRQD